MPRTRGRGEGSLYWSASRQRWIAEVTTGWTPAGRRETTKRSAKTKTQAREKLKDLLRNLEDGLPIEPTDYTVADAVGDWLRYGTRGSGTNTIGRDTTLATTHIMPILGRRQVRELSADEVDQWLDDLATTLSTDTVRKVLSVLRRSIAHAQARDKVKRNVVVLCKPPAGRNGRPSKSLALPQAAAVLDAAEADDSPVGDYIVVSLTTGARTEEVRALRWDHVDDAGQPAASPPIPPSVAVWRSVRADGDTKTVRSRRTLAAPQRAVAALGRQRGRQRRQRELAGERWKETGLVFTTRYGTSLEAGNVRRSFRRIVRRAGLDESQWTPRELRHSFVSLLSNHGGLPVEAISRLVGHASTRVTETVYRTELRPALLEGAEVMDGLFGRER